MATNTKNIHKISSSEFILEINGTFTSSEIRLLLQDLDSQLD